MGRKKCAVCQMMGWTRVNLIRTMQTGILKRSVWLSTMIWVYLRLQDKYSRLKCISKVKVELTY